MSATRSLAEFVATTDLDDVPADVVSKAKQSARAFVAAALYSGRHVEEGRRIQDYVAATYPGEEASVIGYGTSSVHGAAVANGSFGLLKGCDDTFSTLHLHPTAPVFPAALAAAERADVTGRELLGSYVVGVETAYRLGHATYPSHYDYWHGTSTIGTFGAAAACASVLGLSTDDVQRVFGLAASLSAGLNRNSSPMHALHSGLAAFRGVQAGVLREEGFTGDSEIFDGDGSYGGAVTGEGQYDPGVLERFGPHWGVTDIAIKIYPAAVIVHSPTEAFYNLLARADVRPEEVALIEATVDESLEGFYTEGLPDDLKEARKSIPYCLAALLHERTLGPAEFSEAYFQSGTVDETMETVRVEYEGGMFDDDLPEYASGHGARVRLETHDGTEHVFEEHPMPGTPGNPISEERLRETFLHWAGTVLEPEAAERTADRFQRLDQLDDLEPLLGDLRDE